jgi:GT2 family glycosyltransferase
MTVAASRVIVSARSIQTSTIMLITFRCKAYPEVMMYAEHAKRILDLLNKDTERGIITAEEAPKAVEVLEQEIAESRKHAPTDDVEQDTRGEDDNQHEGLQSVSFGTRAYPLLEMLRAARDHHREVMWGV